MNVISVLCSGTGPGRGAAPEALPRRLPPPPLPLAACAVATEPLPALLLRRSEWPPAELPCEPEAFQLLKEGSVDSPAASGWMSGSEGWGPGSGAGASPGGTAADACSAAVLHPLPDGCKVWAATLAAGVLLAATDSWAAARLRPGEHGCGTAGTPAGRPAAAGTFVHGCGAAASGRGAMVAVLGLLVCLLERSDSPTPSTKSSAMSCGTWRRKMSSRFRLAGACTGPWKTCRDISRGNTYASRLSTGTAPTHRLAAAGGLPRDAAEGGVAQWRLARWPMHGCIGAATAALGTCRCRRWCRVACCPWAVGCAADAILICEGQGRLGGGCVERLRGNGPAHRRRRGAPQLLPPQRH